MESSTFGSTYLEEVYAVPALVTIVLGIPWSQIKEEHTLLLSKILQSVQLSLESVRIVYQPQLDISRWSEKPSKLIAFLPPPKGLATYEVIQTGDTSIIFSDTLEILNADDAVKRKLWNALKSHFGQ